MIRIVNRLGDRLLAAVAPKTDAAAQTCFIRSVGGGCYRRCCYTPDGLRCGAIFC